MFKNPVLSAGFAMSTLVTTVVMATLVVGPFYLTLALGLDAVNVGLVMASGPFVAALAGAPAGRLVDRLGSARMTISGLAGMAAGALAMIIMPATASVPGYVIPLALITAGYAAFQAANNTAVLADISPDQRGVSSGLLNLSRNLGLITGASFMGKIFAAGAETSDITSAPSNAIANGMHVTFAVAALLIFVAMVIQLAARRQARRHA
jgi:MFS family permease